MSDVRYVTGRRSREVGTQVGMQINLFGMTRLMEGVTGHALADILLESAQPALADALAEWPVLTGASRDSIELVTTEVEERRARVQLRAGGDELINDPRNESHKDYAPFIEFNGTATASSGILVRAIHGNDTAIRSGIHDRVAALVERLTRG